MDTFNLFILKEIQKNKIEFPFYSEIDKHDSKSDSQGALFFVPLFDLESIQVKDYCCNHCT